MWSSFSGAQIHAFPASRRTEQLVAKGINWQTAPLIYKRSTEFALQLLAEMSA